MLIGKFREKKFVVSITAISATLALVGCGDDSSTDDSAAGADCSVYQQYGDLKGKEVGIFASIVAPQSVSIVDSFKAFEKCTGAKINYEGITGFEDQLRVRVKGGNLPDLALIPQPGLVTDMVKTGKAKKASANVEKNVDEFFGADWKAYGTVDGTFYAAPFGANVKSYVWYSPSFFQEKGYQVPQTLDELTALTDKIATDNADGKVKPWCAGIAAEGATGWPITDWVEDMLLRTADADTYDKWVKHEIPFNDPKVTEAMDAAGAILKNDKYVNGGIGDVKTIATTTFQDGGLTVLDGSCAMHRQASFYGDLLPEGTTVGPEGDIWAFYLPAKDPAAGKPVLGGGEFLLAFSDRPEVQAVQAYLSSDVWANEKAKATKAGGWISANKKLDPNNLVTELDKQSVQILQDPEAVFRFDGSDMMPAAVGAGSFWKESTNWITGKSTKDTLDAIEKSWPKS
ncbi:MAG: ABC transporter substrate-binding protein [Actinomycetota bacterium]